MIKEEYVSFELAKMLKEKGFEAETEHEIYYVVKDYSTGVHWNSCDYHVGDITREYEKGNCIPMPTLQMAQKWFREEKHLAINPSTYYRKLEGHEFHNWGCNIVNLDTWEVYCSNPLETFPADTYEEALEKAMKYALEKFV